MPDSKQLPYLLKLLEDESRAVQDAVLKELIAFGPSLEEELLRLSKPPTAGQRRLLQKILIINNRDWLRQAWPGWFRLKGDKERLESALSLIADFQYGRTYPIKLKNLLDRLAEEYQANYKVRNIFELAHFLFKVKQLRGAKKDYYNPYHSNLVYVIKEKRGIPISLASVYILVGHRLGLNIQGCNFPGHFLARVHSKDKSFLVDCFDGGRFMDEKDIMEAHSASSKIIHDIIQAEPDAITMIGRVLRNLVQAYQYSQDWDNSDFMLKLIKSLDNIRVGHDDVNNH